MVNGLKELTYSGSYDESVNIRLTLYKAGFEAFFVKPIFGFGIGNLLEPVTNFYLKTVTLDILIYIICS